MRMLKKGQGKAFQIQEGIRGEVRLVERVFNLGLCALAEALERIKTEMEKDPELKKEIEEKYGRPAA